MSDVSSILGYDFETHLTRFARNLRTYGLMIGPTEISDAMNIFTNQGFMDRASAYWCLRSLFVNRFPEINMFDQAFRRFWTFEYFDSREVQEYKSDIFTGGKKFSRRRTETVLPEHDPSSGNVLFQPNPVGASPRKSEEYRDVSHLAEINSEEVSRIASNFVRSLADKPGRRYQSTRHGTKIDLRRLLRESFRAGGEPCRIPLKSRKPRLPNVVFMLDVSGSMDKHSRNLLHLAYETCRKTSQVKVFVFSTDVSEVTREMKSNTMAEALTKISGKVAHWSGGTRIGDCLTQLSTEFSFVLNRYTTFVLMSDGWDTGDPEDVSRKLSVIKRTVKKLVWLNPLIGSGDYEQATRTLEAAVPFVDVFASSRNINELKKLPALIV